MPPLRYVPQAWSSLAISALALVTIAGCGNAKQSLESNENLKQLCSGLMTYEQQNQAWPDSLDDIKPLVGKPSFSAALGPIGNGKDFATLTKNPVTGDSPGYEYVKPPEGTKPSEHVVILYQLRAGKRDPSLSVGYANGAVETPTK